MSIWVCKDCKTLTSSMACSSCGGDVSRAVVIDENPEPIELIYTETPIGWKCPECGIVNNPNNEICEGCIIDEAAKRADDPNAKYIPLDDLIAEIESQR